MTKLLRAAPVFLLLSCAATGMLKGPLVLEKDAWQIKITGLHLNQKTIWGWNGHYEVRPYHEFIMVITELRFKAGTTWRGRQLYMHYSFADSILFVDEKQYNPRFAVGSSVSPNPHAFDIPRVQKGATFHVILYFEVPEGSVPDAVRFPEVGVQNFAQHSKVKKDFRYIAAQPPVSDEQRTSPRPAAGSQQKPQSPHSQPLAAEAKASVPALPRSALSFAAEKGNVAEVRRLLRGMSVENINAKDKKGNTALLYAAMNDHAKVVSILLKASADPAVINNQGKGIWSTSREVMARLIEAKVNVDLPDRWGRTPLMRAAAGLGNPFLVNLFLKSGADVNARSHDQKTALLHLANQGWATVLDGNEEGDLDGLTVQMHGNSAVYKQLIAAGVDVQATDDGGWSAAHYAARASDYWLLKALIEAGAQADTVTTNNTTPLLAVLSTYNYAVNNDSERTVSLILAQKPLLRRKLFYDTTYLIKAAMYNFPDVVKKLLAAGLDVDARNKQGYTALHQAAHRADSKVVRLLIGAKANINLRAHSHQTPLIVAAGSPKSEALDVVKMLLSQGAQVHWRDSRGKSALWHAVEKGRVEMTNLLIKAGSAVTTTNRKGNSLLFFVRKIKPNAKMERILLRAGAD